MKKNQFSQTNGELSPIPRNVYTRKEAAIYLRISPRTLDGLINTEQIKSIKCGKRTLLRLRDINQFIENALPQIETDRQRIISNLLDKNIQLEAQLKEAKDKNSMLKASLPTAYLNVQNMLKEAEWWRK